MKTLLVIFSFALLAGCDSGALETGYRPRKLTDSSAERQAYYAPAFSPEATQGGHTGGAENPVRRSGRY